MDKLPALVQNLPLELYYIIYDLTFTPDAAMRAIDSCYEPPSLLAVNCASRAQFAKLYYGASAIFDVNSFGDAIEWLRSLPELHRELLSEVHCLDDRIEGLFGPGWDFQSRLFRIEFNKVRLGMLIKVHRMIGLHRFYTRAPAGHGRGMKRLRLSEIA